MGKIQVLQVMKLNHVTSKNGLDEIQLARAFAILAVLVVHSSSSGVTQVPTDSLLYPIYNFLNIAGKLGTPTFIMLSSFVLFYNYYPRKTDFQLIKRFYQKRLKFIIVPYILFSLLYFLIKWYVYYDYGSITDAASRFLYLLALGKNHPHLYFVFISVQLYLLFPLLLILFKKLTFLRYHAIWIGITLQWVWVILNKNYFHITLKGSISLSYLSFYFIGAYLGIFYFDIKNKMQQPEYKDKVLIPVFIGYGAIVMLYTGYMYLVRVGGYKAIADSLPQFVTSYISEFTWATHALLAGLVLFYLAHRANKKFSSRSKMIFMEIGATSFGIYLIHPLYLMGARALFPGGSPLEYHSWQVITFLLISSASWAVVRLTFHFVPKYWIIFGKLAEQQKLPKNNKRTQYKRSS
ncbi:acyltransferase [Thalassobacillus pellis]|uniref:acyltransferase n=1 Tax=Thalassobacillus pellis TaxID=748008 RepID=UPI001960D6A7|nr:acyltransferase [Thalassobacillus pellis]MBM7551696.1 peptidoglycan/LPS O-acetylase OafA/YrhL [Thalassobacillus pellis]